MEQFAFERPKATFDEAFTEVNIADWLGQETISDVTFSAVDSAGGDATAAVLDLILSTFTGTYLYPWIKGGVDGEKYTVLCQVDTAEGSQQEFRVIFKIREAP
jgi:hypothetical protein